MNNKTLVGFFVAAMMMTVSLPVSAQQLEKLPVPDVDAPGKGYSECGFGDYGWYCTNGDFKAAGEADSPVNQAGVQAIRAGIAAGMLAGQCTITYDRNTETHACAPGDDVAESRIKIKFTCTKTTTTSGDTTTTTHEYKLTARW